LVFLGDGFFSDGARLGGSHDVPLHIGRIKALEAAEKRRTKLLLMSGGGKLGGGSIATKGMTMREVLAEVRFVYRLLRVFSFFFFPLRLED
jgi:hypothetical protein